MTVASQPRRDYSLTGPSSRRAVEAGLAAAEWYHTDVPRKVMKEMMARRDGQSARRLRANLRRARPDATDEELAALTRDGLRSYLRYWAESFRLPAWETADLVARLAPALPWVVGPIALAARLRRPQSLAQHSPTPPARPARVSVIVPARNEGGTSAAACARSSPPNGPRSR